MYTFDPKRLEKLAALREAGVEPYPNGFDKPTHTLAELKAIGGEAPNEELQTNETVFTVAGRLRFKNEMGKAGFARIQDESGRMQLFIRKNDLGEDTFRDVWKKLDLGDWVWARGRLMRTRKGELSLHLSELKLYAKCIESLPDKHKGFNDAAITAACRDLELPSTTGAILRNGPYEIVQFGMKQWLTGMEQDLNIHEHVNEETKETIKF